MYKSICVIYKGWYLKSLLSLLCTSGVSPFGGDPSYSPTQAPGDQSVVLRGGPHPLAPSHLPHPESQAAAALTFVCGSGSHLRMGAEAILLVATSYGLPPTATASRTVAAAIRIVATGGICMRFLASRFLEVQMASLMAAKVSQRFENSFAVFFLRLTP